MKIKKLNVKLIVMALLVVVLASCSQPATQDLTLARTYAAQTLAALSADTAEPDSDATLAATLSARIPLRRKARGIIDCEIILRVERTRP